MLGTEEEDLQELPGKLRSVLLLLPKDEMYRERLQEKNSDVGVGSLAWPGLAWVEVKEMMISVSATQHVLHSTGGWKCLRYNRANSFHRNGVKLYDLPQPERFKF